MTHVYYLARFPWRSRAVVNERLTSRPSSVPLGVVIIFGMMQPRSLARPPLIRAQHLPRNFF
jgi:hypothetical protein